MPEVTVPKFIVVFKDEVKSEEITKWVEDLDKNGGSVHARWDNSGGILNGFAATIPESYFSHFKSLTDDVVAYIEPDGVVTIQT